MRIAIVLDIHGNLAALEAVTEDLRRRTIDAVVTLGDSLSGPLLPLETSQFQMSQECAHLSGARAGWCRWRPRRSYIHSHSD